MDRLLYLAGAFVLVVAGCSSDSDDGAVPGNADGGKGGSVGMGECQQPVKLLDITDKTLNPEPSFRDIAVDDTNLYATLDPGQGTVPKIVIVPKAGGTKKEVVVSAVPYSVAVDEKNVYWLSDGLYRMAKTGTTPELITEYTGTAVPQAHALALDDTYAYFGVYRLKKTATAATKAEFQELYDVPSEIKMLELVGDTLYVGAKKALYKVPKAGGTPVELASGFDDFSYFSVCGGWAAWVADSVLFKVKTDGGTVVKVGKASNVPTSFNGIACDGTAFYFAAGVDTYRVPVDGNEDSIQKFGCDGGYRLIMDSTSVYWIGYNDSQVDLLKK